MKQFLILLNMLQCLVRFSKQYESMKPEMRQKLAREPFPEKIRKVAQLIRLAKTFPRRHREPQSSRAAK